MDGVQNDRGRDASRCDPMLIETAPPPTAGLLASLGVWFWIDLTEAGHVAFVLLAHPPARREAESPESIEGDMRGLATALSLADPSARLPDIGPRLVVHGRSALLSLDGCQAALHVPGWRRVVRVRLRRRTGGGRGRSRSPATENAVRRRQAVKHTPAVRATLRPSPRSRRPWRPSGSGSHPYSRVGQRRLVHLAARCGHRLGAALSPNRGKYTVCNSRHVTANHRRRSDGHRSTALGNEPLSPLPEHR